LYHRHIPGAAVGIKPSRKKRMCLISLLESCEKPEADNGRLRVAAKQPEYYQAFP
jgi:hypothetical protein